MPETSRIDRSSRSAERDSSCGERRSTPPCNCGEPAGNKALERGPSESNPRDAKRASVSGGRGVESATTVEHLPAGFSGRGKKNEKQNEVVTVGGAGARCFPESEAIEKADHDFNSMARKASTSARRNTEERAPRRVRRP